MKKSVIQIKYNAEKLAALNQYMSKKETTLNLELEDAIQKLYEKHVPSAVREYIEGRNTEEKTREQTINTIENQLASENSENT